MKSLLLVATFHAIGFGMTWSPFPNCTESHQVDSVKTLVWIDLAMKPELAPYRGYAKYRYHPGTCLLAQTEFKPYYLDTSFIVETTLSADRRRQDYRWLIDDAQGTLWYSATGEVDSILEISYSQAEGEPLIRRSRREIRQRSAQSLVITHSYRIDDESWEVFDKDSVVMSDTVTTIYSIEEMETSYITRCVTEGSAYTCTPTLIEGPGDNLKKQVWHLTGNRPDSLRTYFLDGRLESTEFWFWSPRALLSIRQPFPRPRFDRVRKFEIHNLLGRMLPKK